jgi:FAD dependent oxidoreductase
LTQAGFWARLTTVNSPWLTQLNTHRTINSINQNDTTDISVIGAGIAGISTAYFLLTNTNCQVTIVEAKTLASGATGHNAGQVTAGFERSFTDMVAEFGLAKAASGVAQIHSAWDLLEKILTKTQIPVQMDRLIGAVGLASKPLLILELEELKLRRRAGVDYDTLWVAEEWLEENDLPAEYNDFINVKTINQIQNRLETNSTQQFFALKLSRKACLNSALFCQELVEFMRRQYPTRFKLYEQSPVSVINFREGLEQLVEIQLNGCILNCQRAVMCTNGFENVDIFSNHIPILDRKFHQRIEGVVGYMTGYLSQPGAVFTKPEAIAYFQRHHGANQGLASSTPYYYLTRRRFLVGNEINTLTVLGGPETPLPEIQNYYPELNYDSRHIQQMRDFLAKNYLASDELPSQPNFIWHGLMGYTPNGIRLIGAEPAEPRVLYNLGCNGVGILPSIYGGFRISQVVKGDKIEPSIFDLKD